MQIHVKKIITMTKITVSSLAIVEQGVWDDKFKFIFSSNKVNCLCVKFRYFCMFFGVYCIEMCHKTLMNVFIRFHVNFISTIFTLTFSAMCLTPLCSVWLCHVLILLSYMNLILFGALFENKFPNFIINLNFLQI